MNIEITELQEYIEKRQRTLVSWKNWFDLGGAEDIGSPVSGREIMAHCREDIRESEIQIEKIRQQEKEQ